jgi:hypothetical protein
MSRLVIATLLLSWSSAATAQETMQRNWKTIRTTLEEHAVDVDVSDTRSDILSISMEKTDTFESGPFKLQWDRRQVADVKLLEIEKHVYVVLSVEGTSDLKAPLGVWHVDEAGVPGLHEGNWRIADEDTRGFNVMLGVGDRIRGDIRGDSPR